MSTGYDGKSSRAGSILTFVGLCWSQEEPVNVGGDSVGVVVVVVLEETQAEEEEVLVSTEGSRDVGMSKGGQNDSGSKPLGTSKSTSQVQSDDDDESWYPSKGENASNLIGLGSGLVVIEGDTLAVS